MPDHPAILEDPVPAAATWALAVTACPLLAAHLAVLHPRSDGRLVDRFRDRVIFPQHSADGDWVIAFLGRAVGTATITGPKYINSPTSPLYRKREQLYSLA